MRLGDGRVVAPAWESERFWARLLDGVVLAPAMVLFVGSILAEGLAAFSHGFAEGLKGGVQSSYETPPALHLLRWAGVLVPMLYEPVMVACWGATVGKLALGIRVVRLADGARVPLGRSWLRAALPAAAGALTLGAGWWVVWSVLSLSVTSGRQWRGWHDSLAGTVVVTKASAVSLRGGTVDRARMRGVRWRSRSASSMDGRWRQFMIREVPQVGGDDPDDS